MNKSKTHYSILYLIFYMDLTSTFLLKDLKNISLDSLLSFHQQILDKKKKPSETGLYNLHSVLSAG